VPSSPTHRPPSALLINLLIGVVCLIWGSTWLVMKTGLEDLPPFLSAGVRFAIASGILVGLAPYLHRREGGERPAVWLWVAVGTLNFAGSYGIVYTASTVLPSGLVSVLWAVFPLMMAGAGHWLLPGERLIGRQWVGFVVGFAGVGLLFRTDVVTIGPEALPAALLLMLSPLVTVVGQTLLKRHGERTSSVLLNRNAMLLGAVLLLLAGAATESGAEARWTVPALLSIAYLAIAGTVVTFSLYFWLLRYSPAHRLSLVAYVTPALALTLGWLVGGEPVTAFTLMGTGTILLGVVLVVRR
jgi:drug/metabolite transporter (DMT)-like permease